MTRPDPVELAAIAIPVFAEAVAVLMFIGAMVIWCGVLAGRL